MKQDIICNMCIRFIWNILEHLDPRAYHYVDPFAFCPAGKDGFLILKHSEGASEATDAHSKKKMQHRFFLEMIV